MGDDTSIFRRPHFLKVVYLGFCFLILFTAYSTAQAFITPLHRGVGFITLALVYGFLAAMSLVAPVIVNCVGLKGALVISSMGYNLFIFCAAVPPDISEIPLLVAACVIGMCGACLWLAQGMYISQIVEHTGPQTKGFVVGIFFAIFGCSNIAGAIITSLLTGIGIDPFIMMRILGGVGMLASLLFLLVPKVPPVEVNIVALECIGKDTESEPPSPLNLSSLPPQKPVAKPSGKLQPVSWKQVMSVPCYSRNMSCLLTCFVAQGAGQVFNFAVFTSLIPVSELAYVLLVFGSLSTTTSLWGKLYDRRGWKPVVYCDVIALVAGVVVCGFIHIRAERAGGPNSVPGYWLMYLCAALLGTSNSCDFSNCGASILRVVPPDPQISTAVWAMYRLLQCGTSMVMLLLNLTVSFYVIAILTAIPYLVMLGAFHFIEFPSAEHRHARVAPEEPTGEEPPTGEEVAVEDTPASS